MALVSQSERFSQPAATLEAFLDSRIGVVEASRAVSATCFALKQHRNPLFHPFVGIDSETDQFPLGAVREQWASEALERYDQERELVEQRYRPMLQNPPPLCWNGHARAGDDYSLKRTAELDHLQARLSIQVRH